MGVSLNSYFLYGRNSFWNPQLRDIGFLSANRPGTGFFTLLGGRRPSAAPVGRGEGGGPEECLQEVFQVDPERPNGEGAGEVAEKQLHGGDGRRWEGG